MLGHGPGIDGGRGFYGHVAGTGRFDIDRIDTAAMLRDHAQLR